MQPVARLVGPAAAAVLLLSGCQAQGSGDVGNLLGTPVEDLAALEGLEFAALDAVEIERVALISRTMTKSQFVLRRGRFDGFGLVWRMRVRRGGNCVATLRQSGRVVRLVRIGKRSWVKGGGISDEKRWTVTDGAGEVCDVGDPKQPTDQLQDLRKGSVTRIDDRRVVKLTGIGNDGSQIVRFVSLRRPHRVLRETSTPEDGPKETTDYGEFDSRLRIAPPPDELVDDPNRDFV